jgi:hypothetical protein
MLYSGIFDNVKLILSETPNMARVETVPDILNKQVRLQIDLQNSGKAKYYRSRNTGLKY